MNTYILGLLFLAVCHMKLRVSFVLFVGGHYLLVYIGSQMHYSFVCYFSVGEFAPFSSIHVTA